MVDKEMCFSILHISDLHYSNKTRTETEYFISSLIEDLNEQGLSYDIICFTGDLVDRGNFSDNPDGLFNSISENIITPLLRTNSLEESRFVMVAGNHDVDLNKLDCYLDAGLKNELTSREKIRNFLNNSDLAKYTPHISCINDYTKRFQGKDILNNKLSYYKIFDINNMKIGVLCINTAWRYNGDSKSPLIVGEKQIVEYQKKLKNCDFKICLMHHPTFFLLEEDKIDIDNLLVNFDLVLSGHQHLLDDKQINQMLRKTIYCTAGKIYPSSDCFNGYSIVKVDSSQRECELILREYDFSIRKFKPYKDSIIYKLDSKDAPKELAQYFRKNLKKVFEENIDKSLITYSLDKESPKSFRIVFEAPCLSTKSEYLKEEDKFDEDILDIVNTNFEDLIFSKENLLFIGRKESGKTSILNKIALEHLYMGIDVVPFIINLKVLPKGKNVIEKIMQDFLLENSSEKTKVSMEELEILLQNGRCLLLFDNFDYSKKSIADLIVGFACLYPNNRYVFTTEENIINSIKLDLPELGIPVRKYFIQTFTKNQIRNLALKWYDIKSIDEDTIIDDIVRHFNDLGIPRTPFTISLILTILNNKKTFNFINEASIMQMFMELLLEKLSLEEISGSSYNFYNKEKYLMYLATYMMTNNKYILELEEYIEITIKYHKLKGFKISDSKFDKIFFEKNILVLYENQVYFRFDCIFEYYIAKVASENENILDTMLKNPLAYFNELCFFTGLNRDNIKALKKIEMFIVPLALESIDNEKQLKNNYILDSSLAIDVSEIEKGLKLNTKDKDKITDKKNAKSMEPIKSKNFADIKDNILDCVFLFGRMIRNSDEIGIDSKRQFIDTYIWCILYSILIISTIVQRIFEHDLLKKHSEEISEEKIKEITDKIKIIIPIAVQNMIVDNIGTKKLELTIKEKIGETKNDNFIKFMYVFLYADLRMSNSMEVIEDYINASKDVDFLILVNYKLYYYYITDHFNNADDKLRSLIAKTLSKIHGRRIDKAKVINELKKDKLLGNLPS